VIEAVILADLGFYVAHRLFHGVPWLWRFHAIHHSIQELDWLAGVRVHVLDQLGTKASQCWHCWCWVSTRWRSLSQR
jgi:sterol desaturase/sphingolipid hydroxylase (fatty acid hydroxylase superfamily)